MFTLTIHSAENVHDCEENIWFWGVALATGTVFA